jgi:hypothetical protein
MKTLSVSTFYLILFFITPLSLQAQYWGERAMEKGFEQTEFFFVPSSLNPYGIGSFKSTSPGLLNDPLVNLSFNPALIHTDSARSGYLYIDFRSAKTLTEESPNYIMPWMSYATSDAMYSPSYPWVYLNSRRELEPVFSGAYIGSPLTGLVLGASYQLMLQDEKYYDVPQGIYRSVNGSDYAGNKAAASSSLPIIDRYNGEDKMHQTGHFISAFSKYEIPSLGSLGLKIGRVLFDRSGSVGSSNLWDSPYYGSSTSLYFNMETRSQNYNHWEVTGGVDIILSEKFSLGATVGWLWGRAEQTQNNDDSSDYNYSSTSYGSYYISSGKNYQSWVHDGNTSILGLNAKLRTSEKQTLQFIYQRIKSTIDIDLGTTIQDTSFSTYSYSDINNNIYSSTSYSYLRDNRTGSGEQTSIKNRFQLSLQWQLDERTNLAFGLQLEMQKKEINTSESVVANMLSHYQSGYDNYSYLSSSNEIKELQWAFTAEKLSFTIPVFLTYKVSDALSLLCGINRVMTQTKINELTLAIFRNRQTNYNGSIKNENNFGERYKTPEESVSDVCTTFLGGINVSPSEHLRMRLMFVPNYRDTNEGSKVQDLQWWISVQIIP